MPLPLPLSLSRPLSLSLSLSLFYSVGFGLIEEAGYTQLMQPTTDVTYGTMRRHIATAEWLGRVKDWWVTRHISATASKAKRSAIDALHWE